MSKVVQSLANRVVFENKERYMEPLNPFIESNFEVISKFYEVLTVLMVPLYIHNFYSDIR